MYNLFNKLFSKFIGTSMKLNAGEFIAADKVNSSTRLLRGSLTTLGSAAGGYSAFVYSTAGIAGFFITVPALIASTFAGIVFGGVYFYGLGTMGAEFATRHIAKEALGVSERVEVLAILGKKGQEILTDEELAKIDRWFEKNLAMGKLPLEKTTRMITKVTQLFKRRVLATG